MTDGSGIDPRYAAQFQRGYDPSQHSVDQASRPEKTPRPDAPVRLPGGPVPTAERVAPGPRLPVPEVVEQAAATGAETVGAETEVDEPPVRRPRLEWALLGVGLALLAAGTGLFVASVEASRRNVGYTPPIALEDYLRDLAIQELPGPCLLAGVVAVCLWVALRSLHPTRRSS